VIVGNVAQYPTEAEAWRATEGLRLEINTAQNTDAVNFSAVIDRYLREKLPRRHSSASKYRSWLTHHVQPKWGHVQIQNVKPLLVEEWLSGLELAPKSKGHIRSIMHILFNWAMKWELIDLDKMNPMKLVRVEGSSKRLRQPRTLTIKEFRSLLERLEEPIRTMCIVAACLGLRASEVAGLQWGDFDWGNCLVHIQRGFVIGYVDEVKTTNSNRSFPVHRALATRLLEYKKETAPYAKDTDWLFSKPLRNGKATVAVDDPANSLTSCGDSCWTGPDWLAHVSAFLLDLAARPASRFEGPAGASTSRGHPHNNEHLHAGDA